MSSARTTTALALAAFICGCGDDVTPAGETPTTGGTTGTLGSTSSGTTSGTTGEGTSSSGDPTSGSGDTTSSESTESTTGETEGDTTEPSVCPTVPFTTIHGVTVGGLAGWQVAGAGDFDGDGVGDYAISTPRADSGLNTDSGRVHLVRGGPSYDDFSLSEVGGRVAGWVIEGEASNHRAGDSVSGLGDINGDGRDDLLISSSARDPEVPFAEHGRWSVVYGVDFDSTPVDIALAEVRTGAGGFAIDGRTNAFPNLPPGGRRVGDVNVDGLSDILIGTPLLENFAGPSAVDVIFGSEDNPGFMLIGPEGPASGVGIEYPYDGAFHGFIVGGGGDINADGIPDILFGTGGPAGPILHVLFGGEDIGTASLEDLAMGIGGFDISLELPEILFEMPDIVEIVGDVNGDGFDDIGFEVTYPLPEMNDQAGIGIVFGKDDTGPISLLDVFEGQGGFVSTRPASDPDPSLGFNIGRAGDVNGDGFADLLIARGADPVSALGGDNVRGRVYVAYGRDGMDALDLGAVADERQGFIFDSPEVNDDFAQSISAGQDVNGDGIPDVLIGAPQDGQFGTVYVLYGFDESCPRVR